MSLFEQTMDGPNDISVNSVKDQNTEVIQTVANRLAIIGDELTLSYQDLSCSSLEKLKSCATLEGSLDILLSVLKALSWKTNKPSPSWRYTEDHDNWPGTISLMRECKIDFIWSQCIQNSSKATSLYCMDETRLKKGCLTQK